MMDLKFHPWHSYFRYYLCLIVLFFMFYYIGVNLYLEPYFEVPADLHYEHNKLLFKVACVILFVILFLMEMRRNDKNKKAMVKDLLQRYGEEKTKDFINTVNQKGYREIFKSVTPRYVLKSGEWIIHLSVNQYRAYPLEEINIYYQLNQRYGRKYMFSINTKNDNIAIVYVSERKCTKYLKMMEEQFPNHFSGMKGYYSHEHIAHYDEQLEDDCHHDNQ